MGPINNIPALVQIMAWCHPGAKPLSEPMMVSLLTHICVTRPQLVKIIKPLQKQSINWNVYLAKISWVRLVFWCLTTGMFVKNEVGHLVVVKPQSERKTILLLILILHLGPFNHITLGLWANNWILEKIILYIMCILMHQIGHNFAVTWHV